MSALSGEADQPSNRMDRIEETGRPNLQIGWLAKGLLVVE